MSWPCHHGGPWNHNEDSGGPWLPSCIVMRNMHALLCWSWWRGGRKRKPFIYILHGEWTLIRTDTLHTLTLQMRGSVRVEGPVGNSWCLLSSSEEPPWPPSLGHEAAQDSGRQPGYLVKPRSQDFIQNHHVKSWSSPVTCGNFLWQKATQFSTSWQINDCLLSPCSF